MSKGINIVLELPNTVFSRITIRQIVNYSTAQPQKINHVFLLIYAARYAHLCPLKKHLLSKVDADTAARGHRFNRARRALCSLFTLPSLPSPPLLGIFTAFRAFSEYVNKSWGENTATERDVEAREGDV